MSADPAPQRLEPRPSSLLRKFISVGAATSLSRLAGFMREALVGAVLGAGPVADAFYAAFRLPNLFRRVFAEGSFNAAFVPLYAQRLESEGQVSANRFASEVASLIFYCLLGITAIALLAMPFLTETLIAPAFTQDEAKFSLTVLMGRIMFPYIFFISGVAFLSSILNARRRYVLAATIPVLLNLLMIGGLLFSIHAGLDEAMSGLVLAACVAISSVLQLAILMLAARGTEFRMPLKLPRLNADTKRFLMLILPGLVTGGITQINLLIGQIVASAQSGAIAIINYADRIMQLPLGIISAGMGIVLLPELSRALGAGNQQKAAQLQDRSLGFALGIGFPAAIGLMSLSLPIIMVLFERGAFTHETSILAAEALAAFAFGLPSFILVKLLLQSFYARKEMRRPMQFALISMAMNGLACILLFPTMGHVGVALATSLSGWLNFVLLAILLYWRGDFRPSPRVVKQAIIILLASLGMGAMLVFSWHHLEPIFQAGSGSLRAFLLFAMIGVAGLLYGLITYISGALDLSALSKGKAGSKIE